MNSDEEHETGQIINLQLNSRNEMLANSMVSSGEFHYHRENAAEGNDDGKVNEAQMSIQDNDYSRNKLAK